MVRSRRADIDLFWLSLNIQSPITVPRKKRLKHSKHSKVLVVWMNRYIVVSNHPSISYHSFYVNSNVKNRPLFPLNSTCIYWIPTSGECFTSGWAPYTVQRFDFQTLGILWFCILNSLILLICRSQVIFVLVYMCIPEYKFPDISFQGTLLTRQLSIQCLEAWIFKSDRLACKQAISAPLIRLLLLAHPPLSHLYSGDNHTYLI